MALPTFFQLPPGVYVVGYLTDPATQGAESMATIAWANTFKKDIQVLRSVRAGDATVAAFRTTKALPYPTGGMTVYITTAPAAEDPAKVFTDSTYQQSAQYREYVEGRLDVASEKANIAQKTGLVGAKLADAAAAGAIEALEQSDPLATAGKIAGVVAGLLLIAWFVKK